MPKDQVFISYSHKDKKWRDDLDTHLKPYLRDGTISTWSDLQIKPGARWETEIDSALTNSAIAVLLVSPDFLNSDFIHVKELGPLLKRAEEGGVKILWIPIRSSSYRQTPLKDYQAVIDVGKPIATIPRPKRDEVWVRICAKIQQEVNRTARPPEAVQQATPPQTAQEHLVPTVSNSSELPSLPSPQPPPSAEPHVLMPVSTIEVGPDFSAERESLFALAAQDRRAAIKKGWELLARDILGAGNIETGRSDPDSPAVSIALERLKSNSAYPWELVVELKDLQVPARKVFNQSQWGYDPSEPEARRFILRCDAASQQLRCLSPRPIQRAVNRMNWSRDGTIARSVKRHGYYRIEKQYVPEPGIEEQRYLGGYQPGGDYFDPNGSFTPISGPIHGYKTLPEAQRACEEDDATISQHLGL